MNTRWQGDERILGEGDFVSAVMKDWEEDIDSTEKMRRAGWNIEKLVDHVCQLFTIKKEELEKKGKNNQIAHAKELISYWGK